ncbi:caspase family protein [Spirochaeta dissipatitropha]
MKRSTIRTLIILFCLCTASVIYAESAPVRRIGMFVGANDGGSARVRLRWAASDAMKMAQVMQELGSINASDIYYLSDPTAAQLIHSFAEASERIQRASENARRVEFIFYYSGHSDDQGLLIGEERLHYSSLRRLIQNAGADVAVAILDGCESGAFTRIKGGDRIQPFLLDESSQIKGFAFLTSSSDSEASQESDRIQASFFTHFVVSGLRGAADTTGNGRISLNELYHYAFHETLAMTAGTVAGPQHPSYDIQISGTGDIILTDISQPESLLLFPEPMIGRVQIRNQQGALVSEFTKNMGSERKIAVPAGSYTVSIHNQERAWQTAVTLRRSEIHTIQQNRLSPISLERARLRGNESQPEYGFSYSMGLFPPAMARFSLGVIHPRDSNLAVALIANQVRNNYGMAISGIYHHTEENQYGLQVAGIASISGSRSYGLTASGIYNQAGDVIGIQAAAFTESKTVKGAQIGLFNQSGTVYGTQIGLINVADDVYGIPIGLINYVRNGINDVSVWFEKDDQFKIGFRNGTRYLYSILFLGLDRETNWQELDALIVGAGLGARIYLPGPFFVDGDINIAKTASGTTVDERLSTIFSLDQSPLFPLMRITGGIRFGRFGLYAGTALYGDLNDLARQSGSRYHNAQQGTSISMPFGGLSIYPQFLTGFTF